MWDSHRRKSQNDSECFIRPLFDNSSCCSHQTQNERRNRESWFTSSHLLLPPDSIERKQKAKFERKSWKQNNAAVNLELRQEFQSSSWDCTKERGKGRTRSSNHLKISGPSEEWSDSPILYFLQIYHLLAVLPSPQATGYVCIGTICNTVYHHFTWALFFLLNNC